jgi:hypothetical protein
VLDGSKRLGPRRPESVGRNPERRDSVGRQLNGRQIGGITRRLVAVRSADGGHTCRVDIVLVASAIVGRTAVRVA